MHRGWGMPRPAWGEFVSQSVILWGMTALGAWLFRAGHKESETARQALRERAVVAYALQHGGRITVAEASVAAQISLHEARNLLERLVLERYATESEEDGIVYYYLTR
jgi:Fic family protein